MRSLTVGEPPADVPSPSAAPVARDVFRRAWTELEREIRECTRCPLHANRTNAVIYRGSDAPRLVFVGEAPGATEDREGVPFVGRSGKRLDSAIVEMGLRAEEFGVLNLVKCRPPRNVFVRSAAATCAPYLDRQLALLRPTILVPLGAEALRSLDPEAPRILLAAGRPRRRDGRQVFPLIHPAASLRSRALAERWQADVRALGVWLSRPSDPSAREPL
ncbi:MAG: uracil-DNA glycosylase [Thermoplasmata archaeon]|nr:uracil-DNA glycosylase [Thermoplasmata archaeon]